MDAFTGMAATYNELENILTTSIKNFNFVYYEVKTVNIVKKYVKKNKDLDGMLFTHYYNNN